MFFFAELLVFFLGSVMGFLVWKAMATGATDCVISDLRGATSFDITSAVVRELAGRPLLFDANASRAVIAPHDLAYGMARMFDLSRTDTKTRIFREEREALAWLAAEEA